MRLGGAKDDVHQSGYALVELQGVIESSNIKSWHDLQLGHLEIKNQTNSVWFMGVVTSTRENRFMSNLVYAGHWSASAGGSVGAIEKSNGSGTKNHHSDATDIRRQRGERSGPPHSKLPGQGHHQEKVSILIKTKDYNAR